MLPSTMLAEGHVDMMLTMGSPFDEIEDYINKTTRPSSAISRSRRFG